MTNNFKIKFVSLPFCECCGENHKEFGVEIDDGNTSWCLDCAYANGDINEEELSKLDQKCNQEKIKYYKQKVKNLETQNNL